MANRLEMLERAGIVKKRKDNVNKTKFTYSLSAKGIDLLPVLIEIIVWTAKYDKQTGAPKAFVRRAKNNREQLIEQIREALKQNKGLFEPR